MLGSTHQSTAQQRVQAGTNIFSLLMILRNLIKSAEFQASANEVLLILPSDIEKHLVEMVKSPLAKI